MEQISNPLIGDLCMVEVVLAVSLFWCRAEPVLSNGDDYYRESSSVSTACSDAVAACEVQYNKCEPKYCGDELSLHYEDPCSEF